MPVKPERSTWYDMMKRCYNQKSTGYKKYGGSGIVVCEFLRASHLNLAELIGPKPSNLFSIDRIQNKFGYHCGKCAECCSNGWPINVRWADRTTQARNRDFVHRLKIGGVTMTPPEWSEKTGIPYRTIKTRMSKGQSGYQLIRPVEKTRVFLFRGKMSTIPDISVATGISKNILFDRARGFRKVNPMLVFSTL